ncbi:MAG: sigma-70 family RNA polymerase sigma factor [Pirellulales bacterium]
MPEPPETRPSLVLRLTNARDDEAWTEFVAIYEPLIIRLMHNHGLQESDARDVCQQVFEALARDIEQWKPDGAKASFRRWLFQIARNRVIKFLDRQRRRPQAAGGTDAQLLLQAQTDPRASASAEFEHEYRRQLLLRAMERIRGEFRESTWQAFWQTCVAGRPIAEVADQLGTTAGNVYVARSRIVARLRDQVSQIEGP